ncbi:MAG: hypothetical protein LBV47_01395, partial [Bacteroidales bacterium]|nr:hypothetical protein [Bacteroidales bacterium]
YCQSGSSCQLAGNPIALMSMVGCSASGVIELPSTNIGLPSTIIRLPSVIIGFKPKLPRLYRFTLPYTTSNPEIPAPKTVHSDKHRLSPTKAISIDLHP